MGGGSKKQKIGTKYYYGFALVPLRQHDALLAIEMNDKQVWNGKVRSGLVNINDPSAFGGKEREGGFVGAIDVQDGNLSQGINSYLAGAKATLTSAMRGCVSLVAQRPYVSANTARLPKIRTKHMNIDGIARDWNRTDAIIDSDFVVDRCSVFIEMDIGIIVAISERARIRQTAIQIIQLMYGKTNNIRMYANQYDINNIFDPPQVFQRMNCNDADYDDAINWINNMVISGVTSTVNVMTLTGASAFFETSSDTSFYDTLLGEITGEGDEGYKPFRKFIFILNAQEPLGGNVAAAQAAIAGMGSVTVKGIAYRSIYNDYRVADDLAVLDNTNDPIFELPLAVVGGTTAQEVKKPFLTWADCNPAHILRCLWTDPARGGEADESEMGDSFDSFADLCIDEDLGLSPKFRGLDQADSDRIDVERHCDAMTYRSNVTGKIEVVPIRDNYVIGDLMTIDTSTVTDWSGLTRPRLSEIPNQLTVTYTRRDGKKGSVTRTNVAGVRRAGRVIKAQKVDYPACTSRKLAIRLCLRDLRIVTTDILSGTLPLTYLPQGIEVGSVFILDNPTLGIDEVVMRVSETRIGKHDDSAAILTISEDKYSTSQAITIVEEEIETRRLAVPPIPRLVTEASYFQGVNQFGQDVLDEALTEEPDLGRFIATGVRGDTNQLDATLAISADGVTYDDAGLVDFEPYGVLIDDLSSGADVTDFLVEYNRTLADVNAGDLARLGPEIIRIDNMVDQGDGTVLVTVGRGCLDGPPVRHIAGSAFIVSSVVEALEQDFIAGQSIFVKMLSRTGDDIQTLDEAETDTINFSSRAIRPYNVGNLKAAPTAGVAEYTLPLTEGLGKFITLTWSHRDRLIQTTPAVDDFTATDIGPEAGVTYETVRQAFYRHARFYDAANLYDTGGFYADLNTPAHEHLIEVGTALTADVEVDVTKLVPATFYDRGRFYDPVYMYPTKEVLYDRAGFYDAGSFYNEAYGRTSAMKLGVKATRTDALGTYENWETPFIFVPPHVPFIGPATTMQELYLNDEAGDYWESGYAIGKAIPDGSANPHTLRGMANDERIITLAGNLGHSGTYGNPTQWRTINFIRYRCTLSRPLSDTFSFWVYGSCSDAGWNAWAQMENGPYIYNISPQYNFQAGRPGTQGVQSNINNPSNATMLVVVEAGVGTSFYVNDVLIGTNAGVSYAAGIDQFELFALWGGGATMNGYTRAVGMVDRVLEPEERTMIHNRNVFLYTTGEELP